MNRHGLVAGATGTRKNVTLHMMAEQLSTAGVPVFLADIKGDLSGLAMAATATTGPLEAADSDGEYRSGPGRQDIFVGWGRAGRPQPADVLSQPGGMDELQAFLSLLTASTGTWAPESAIWRSGVVISRGTPSLTALETSPESTCLS